MDFDVLVLGSINCDRVMHVIDFPKPGETIRCLSSAETLGGKGANQAIAAARAGAQVIMYGAVGDDEAGRAAKSKLESCLDIRGLSTFANCPTGTAAIQISQSGENYIVIDGGANAKFTAAYLPAPMPSHRICLAQLEVPIETIEAFFAAASEAGAMTILNAAPVDVASSSLAALCDILVVNQTELATLAGASRQPGDADAATAMARSIIAHERQIIIVTLGSAGAVAIGPDLRIDVAGRPAEVVDTTGAGDCFCGVLAGSLAEGAGLESAIVRANAAAALQVSRRGAADAMPVFNDIEAALNFSRPSA